MSKSIEFYFDFISPYTYLAHKRILEIEKLEKIKFIYKPILLGGLHNLGKITPAAFIEAKKKFTIHDCQMGADKLNINFKFNDNFPINSLSLMRGVLVVEKNKVKKYIEIFFEAYWELNLDLSVKKIVAEILEKLDIWKDLLIEISSFDKLVVEDQVINSRVIFDVNDLSIKKRTF